MAETDVLNATVTWQADINDSIGPDYGWSRMRRSQLAVAKPAGGRPWSRTIGNGGHSTQFSWINRSRACVERLKQWNEQFEDGFFTIIDHDGGGRHYVGNFVGDMEESEAGNDRWNVQGWTFEEIPGCPMVEYPSNWDAWAVMVRPIDDYGDQKVATVSTVAGAWAQPAAVLQDDGTSLVPKQLANLTPTAGDFLTQEYRGYGFRLWMLSGPEYGQATLFVDGVQVAVIDLYNAAEQGETIVYENAQMPLDIHRVKLVLTGVKNAAATGTGAVLDKFEVMR